MNVIIDIWVGIHSICKSNCLPGGSIMGVFDFIVSIITSNVVPRVSHGQPIKSKLVGFIRVKFQRWIKLNSKITRSACSSFFPVYWGNVDYNFLVNHLVVFFEITFIWLRRCAIWENSGITPLLPARIDPPSNSSLFRSWCGLLK